MPEQQIPKVAVPQKRARCLSRLTDHADCQLARFARQRLAYQLPGPNANQRQRDGRPQPAAHSKQNPQERAQSAQRLSEIAVQQLDSKASATAGDSPIVIEERLKYAVANETDPQARAAIAAALAKLQKRQLVESSLNPLTQRFK
jgi:hypothetical protein